tara:strand:+ start:17887 stop:18318 length:432 start_codon:yes stop_codon:yes gene_type:complete
MKAIRILPLLILLLGLAQPSYAGWGDWFGGGSAEKKATEESVNALVGQLDDALSGYIPDAGKVKDIVGQVNDLLPAMKDTDFFDKQKLTSWLSTSPVNESKVLMAALYLKEYSDAMTPEMKASLKQLMDKVGPIVRGYLDQAL